jgi:hypothetical protein
MAHIVLTNEGEWDQSSALSKDVVGRSVEA